MRAVKPGDLLVAVDGHAFRHPESLFRVRGSDVVGTEVRLMVERSGTPPFECTLLRDAYGAVQLKAKIISCLDRLILLVSDDVHNKFSSKSRAVGLPVLEEDKENANSYDSNNNNNQRAINNPADVSGTVSEAAEELANVQFMVRTISEQSGMEFLESMNKSWSGAHSVHILADFEKIESVMHY